VTAPSPSRHRRQLRITGIVQGVGFRPFVYALAGRFGLAGHVGNDSAGVFVEVEGEPAAVAAFVAALTAQPPPLAQVDGIQAVELPVVGEAGFAIVASQKGSAAVALVTADTAICADCLRELEDPADRRYRYPFVNCTQCGPRFTITRTVPYDRPNTTMDRFEMCSDCAAEYADPADRRFHAQPICCPACGPRLSLLTRAGVPVGGDPIEAAAGLLAAGRVLAVKGLGGYHLAADAGCETAVAALRSRKLRADKPFAVMVADLPAARRLALLDQAAERLLTDQRAPIVLVPRRPDAPIAAAVAPRTAELGLYLPYTPLHRLLADALGRPFVLTSGNVSDEPIAYLDQDARLRLAGIADAFLVHDRAIHMRTDDSVARVVRGRPTMLRRSRGYVPAPLPLPVPAIRPVLACGAELKSTFCLVRGGQAFVSHHIGDLENAETFASYTEGITHFRRLFDIEPELVAHDLHPEYLSTKYALSLDGIEPLGVQHHHAHIASCLADNGEPGPVIGIACDGTGYGSDGALWGGEVLVADLCGYRRLAHLAEVPLPGGAAAIRHPWRMAAAYLGAGPIAELAVRRRHAELWDAVCALAASDLALRTTSAGRLFDAVAALTGVCDSISYEGQAAIEFEQRVDPNAVGCYPMRLAGELLHGADLMDAAAEDLRRGVPVGTIAARFHRGLAGGLAAAAQQAAERTGLRTVALSGGVFGNLVLLAELVRRLEDDGFRVLTHSRVPPNDGGISLGQAAVAAATLAGADRE
jgi:hydrogenase maturation protein HypF